MVRPTDWYVLDVDGDPAPGDPLAVRDLSRRFLALADDARRASSGVRGASADGAVTTWSGQSGDAFREEIGALPGQLEKLSASYGIAGHALLVYASALTVAQGDSYRALIAGRIAADHLAGARSDATAARVAVGLTGDGTGGVAGGGTGSVAQAIMLPDAAAVAAATRNHAAAQARLTRARANAEAAGSDLDAARRLALAARDLREQAEDAAVRALRDASHAGIRNRHWFNRLTSELAGAWHTTVRVCTIAGLVLAVASLVVSGPLIGSLLAVTALVALADALLAYRDGRAGLFGVVLAIAAVLPAGRLAHAAAVRARLTGAARALREAPDTGRAIARDVTSTSWEREPGEWHRLLSARADLIATREKRMVRRVTAAIRPHYDRFAGRWPIMTVDERNNAIRQIHNDVRGAMSAPAATCTPKYMPAHEYGYTWRVGKKYFMEVNNNTAMEATVSTIIHETRHSFQLRQIERLERGWSTHPDARAWARNFLAGNYAEPQADYAAYRAQAVEIDADATEHAVGARIGRWWPGR